ncbi:hypothetical protein ACSDQ9_03010 [Aestuariimicrobium soli]|uniref:hypothetical protein n=1 Tax=Aestuariimicrobium soli TaxID=2035834 RepID=UPI003EBE3AA9
MATLTDPTALGWGDDPSDEDDVTASTRLQGADDELDDEDADDETPWAPDQGFPDPWGIATVWLDEDDLIGRVRMSVHWRSRLGQGSLAQAFGQIFMLINNHREGEAFRSVAPADDRPAPRPMSWEALADLRERSAELNRRLLALPAEVRGRHENRWTDGFGAHGNIRITLNPTGALSAIAFNEGWLGRARIKELSDGIVEAHRAARAAWVPPAYERSERDDLIDQLTATRDELTAMLGRGFA